MNEVTGGVSMNEYSAGFTQIATTVADGFDIGQVFSAIANFAPIWVPCIVLGIGLMLLRRVLRGANKGKAKI